MAQADTPTPGETTPLTWRLAIGVFIVALGLAAYQSCETIGLTGQAAAGCLFFFGLVAMFSDNLRAVNWSTIGWGIVLQLVLAVLVLKVEYTRDATVEEKNRHETQRAALLVGAGALGVLPVLPVANVHPPETVTVRPIYMIFETLGYGVKAFIGFSDKGAEFVFGNLARPGDLALRPGADFIFIFAFKALPPILFVSAFFTVLYHFGVLQWCVRLMARGMVYLLGTSGAETLSVSANVFMGQTEAPLIVKPYVPRMTSSELFTLMVSGFAHISGGMMVVYINYGADPVAVLTTCVMACPCSLYLAKLFMPETAIPETAGSVDTQEEKSPFANATDAATAGTSDGLRLALNVAAMLIVFIAFVAMFDALLAAIKPTLVWFGVDAKALSDWPDNLSLRIVFGWLFAPAAFLMGVDMRDIENVGTLLGSKLAINEHYAYLQMKAMLAQPNFMTERSYQLAAFALTGFANFASVGIQLGGIGAMAPERRGDLARLGARALFVGFVATLLNASVAGVLL
ncbi:MAG: Na+ dependent nucleoside transporter domain protein [Planctomycetes bacterium]|nr:Na+ dependent nucleoside transporter domain protein [Planctomycetota bacterium]